MSYAIFRMQGIKTTSDLKGIGMHNKERISHTNDEIDKSRSKDNIILIDTGRSYKEKFNSIVSEMKKEHEERMKTMRKDRVKTFEQHINSSKNDVATEFVFTSDEEFFKDMSKDQIKEWAESSLDFVINDIGIDKKHIIDATVHLDEKVPHLHIVAVPLVKSFNKKQKKDIWSISRRQFITGREDLSKLQDTYHQKMNKKGYKLERGERGTDRIHTSKAEYVAQTIKVAESVKKSLDDEIKALKSDLKAFEELEKDISSIEAKKGLLGKISISEKDYNNLLELAKVGATKIKEYEELKVDYPKLQRSYSNLYSSFDEVKIKNINMDRELQKIRLENFDFTRQKKDSNREKLALQRENKYLKNFIIENGLREKFNQEIKEMNPNKNRDLGMER